MALGFSRALLCGAFVSPLPAQELSTALAWFDRDKDGIVDPHEGAEAMMYLTVLADEDGDGKASPAELAAMLEELAEEEEMDGIAFMIEEEISGFFDEFDEDGDDIVTRKELPFFLRSEMDELDLNGDKQIERSELRELLESEMSGAEFVVVGTRAYVNGTLGPSTPGRVLKLIIDHPEVDTLVLQDVPGSMDDHSNVRAARLVRTKGYTTVVDANGMIASGGVDFFLAGAQRRVGPHCRLGVHSWSDGEREGADYPRDHHEHQMFLDLYEDLEVDEEFYWYTLEAASAEDIHWMTPEELERYSMTTEPWDFDDEILLGPDPYGLEAIVCDAVIVPLPEHVDAVLQEHFDRYTRVITAEGRPIHVLVSPEWHPDQVLHVRKVLQHYLGLGDYDTPTEAQLAVADAMADRRATMVLFEDQPAMERALSGPLGELQLGMQDLRANECPAPGDADYMAHRTRDAAYEEILHLVHQYGIRPGLPEYDRELQAGNDAAEQANLWDAWPEEEPDSHRYEYIAAAYDNYLDLWTVCPAVYEGQEIDGEVPEGTSHFGTYRAGSRALMAKKDPEAIRLIEAYFPPALTYTAELPTEFTGTFSLRFDESQRYTTKTQHLRHVTLRGSKEATLLGNDADNRLTGNAGPNVIVGGGGHDKIDGGPGEDIAQYSGSAADYSILNSPLGMLVRDTVEGRDGEDTLISVEKLRFADGERELK